ncbi:hypothetical protein PG987_005999 [Apiospora arundinis]
MEERGTQAESSGTQSTQFKAPTSGKAIPDSQPKREPQASSDGKHSLSPDSALQDAQHQLVLSLAKLVQNTIEKETKDLLRQIRDNGERQTTLLKAALADSWCDPGQAAQIKADLTSQEPWKASDDTLVSIQIDTNDQEVDETNMSYPLRYLCHEFEDELQPERIAMVIILAIWGFRKFVNDRPESIAADLEALGEVMSTTAEELDGFLGHLGSVQYWLSRGARMDLRLERGETYLRIKPRRISSLAMIVSQIGQSANEELAKLMMQRGNRTRRESDYQWVRYHKGLEPLPGGENPPEFGSISIVKAPSTQKKESFLSTAALATTISRTAITAPGGLTNSLVNLAMGYLKINPGIRTCKWLGGISIYQRTLMVALEVWHREWNETFDSVDKVLNVRLEDVFDAEKRAALMFEASSNNRFESSDKYFFVIELLRISAEWIKETVNDLRYTQEEVTGILQSLMCYPYFPGEATPSVAYVPDASWKACADVIRHNWEVVFRDLKRFEDDLLGRIERKTQEVKSLRDGLFSATSVKEATKSTQINECILVFTVMTITYLPLGFVATLYGLDMFDFRMPGQTKSFAITIVAVALTTYLVAGWFLYEVRQRRKKKGLLSWIQHTTDSTKHAFGASKSVEKAAGLSNTSDIEVEIHDTLPPEDQHAHKKETSNWKAIPDWFIGRRRSRKASSSV